MKLACHPLVDLLAHLETCDLLTPDCPWSALARPSGAPGTTDPGFLEPLHRQLPFLNSRVRSLLAQELVALHATLGGCMASVEDWVGRMAPVSNSRERYMQDSSMAALPLFAAVADTQDRSGHELGLSLCESARRFDKFGQSPVELQEAGITYLVNEFWTSAQRQAHSLHEVSYRACFKAQLPEFFIKRLTKPGDAVYDPFMGRGTTAVQAALMGRRPIGNDINPLSILLTRPRLTPPTLHEVARRLALIEWDSGEIDDPKLLVFYSPRTLRHICALRSWLIEQAPLGGES